MVFQYNEKMFPSSTQDALATQITGIRLFVLKVCSSLIAGTRPLVQQPVQSNTKENTKLRITGNRSIPHKGQPYGKCFHVTTSSCDAEALWNHYCCGYTLTDFPISIRLTSLALWQSNDCPSGSKATLMNMDKYFMWIHYERLHNHNKAKHNKTVCIFLGIYCISGRIIQ